MKTNTGPGPDGFGRGAIRRVLSLILVPCLYAVFAAPASAQTGVSEVIRGDSFREVAGKGLVIRTEPDQAKVFVDGVERGLTPLTLDTIRSGIHVVRIFKEGYRERIFNVTLSSSSRLVMSVELEASAGQALITLRRSEGSPPPGSYPLEPEILVDGKSVPFSPAELAAGVGMTLPVGYHTIQARAFGWEDTVTTVYIREGFIIPAELVLAPAPFRIIKADTARPRFNPANSGSLGITRFSLEVSGPGRALLTVQAPDGETVYTSELGPFTSRFQTADWNGRAVTSRNSAGILPNGAYRVTIDGFSIPRDGSEPARHSVSFEVAIDSSISIYPLSLNGAVPGLIFAATPAALPRGSFQLEGGLVFGSPAGGGAFSSLPFEGGIRLSVIEGLELAAALNAVPVFGEDAFWGFALSAKWRFVRTASRFPLEAAAGLSYAWSQEDGRTPQKEGLSVRLPLSLDFRRLSLIFAPGIRTAFPEDPLPRLFFPAGILFRHAYITAGVSFLPEISFSARQKNREKEGPAVLELGAEIKWYPSPSVLVYTISGGLRMDASGIRGFGGVGIGIIY
ncbi:MAG: PEGA domain-containing protein [Treponema sp.]|nr:PEGA domain-containing protein [Treponema sp.]